MRKTEEELREQFSFTYDNYSEILYGDKPKEHRDEEWYDRICKLTDGSSIISNIFAVPVYQWKKFGDYDVYETLRGEIGVKDGVAFYGSFFVDYRGLRYNIYYTGTPDELVQNLHKLNNNSLHISHNGEFVTGWRNECGMHSPSAKVRELDADRVMKILLCDDWKDFGTGVQLFRNKISKVYEDDPRNYFTIL